MTYILGINFSSHDTSACLLKDGELLGFAEEERFNRVKHTYEFPERAIDYLLKNEGIVIDRVDYVAFPTSDSVPLKFLVPNSLRFGILGGLPLIIMNLRYRFKFWRVVQNFKRRLNGRTKVILVGHHDSHLANAFLISPFQKAAILTIDGAGDGLASQLAFGEDSSITKIDSICFPHSVGLLYLLVTMHLGFGDWDGGEGKVMGLSSYGDPNRYVEVFRDMVQLKKDGTYALNMKYFRVKRTNFPSGTIRFFSYFTEKFGPQRKGGEPILKQHEDIAAGLQKIVEETVVHMLNHLHKQTKSDNLVISGGVALNSVMNGKLHRQTPFKNIFVQPIAYDGGNSIGAAFHVWNNVLGNPRRYQFSSCYLGPEFSDESTRRILDENKLKYEILDDPSKRAAKLISDGRIIGWFQGRMEAGARALGNRSILADPRRAEMKDIVNTKIKFREPYRPFAPVVLAEKASDYFDVGKLDHKYLTNFMLAVFPVKKHMRKIVPAITHVDGSARPQIITKGQNSRYYNIVKAFGRKTGVYVLMNTSFNLKGEPIVNTPENAFNTFKASGLDYLALERFIVDKNDIRV